VVLVINFLDVEEFHALKLAFFSWSYNVTQSGMQFRHCQPTDIVEAVSEE
jgi:hypothetical protein